MAYLTERLGVPPAADIFSPNEERLAIRPRLHFGAMSIADLRKRAVDPRFAAITAHVREIAARFGDSPPPATANLDTHDPNRPFADSLQWMAMAALLARDDDERNRALAGLIRWVHTLRAWGPFRNNLPLAQSTISLSLVYDWLHDMLPAEELDAIRTQIIANVRLSLDQTHGGLTMWRGQRFAANHNWAHHSARAFAALALWGESDPTLAPGELRAWLDDAMVNFWIVKQTHSNDGAPMEGPTYQDYAMRFYVDFCVQTETLLHLKESFFDEHMQKLSARLFTLLPGNRRSMVYADGLEADWWDACSHFRRLASHFQDERLQLVGHIMATCGDPRALPTWRDFFSYDPDLPCARQADLPLFHDMPDFGLYTARSDWGDSAAFFGLRCGPASAESVAERFGFDLGEGHVYPNQGDFTFHLWSRAIIPGCEYPTTKVTTNHNLVVFEGRDTQSGRLVGQVGEGGPWFNAQAAKDPDADYDQRQRTPRVVSRDHQNTHHQYLCDLGGLYRLRDERVAGGVFFPDYWRSITFLPDGAVAIVDRVRVPLERTVHFRLLTAIEDLGADAKGFGFTHSGVPARIDDFSPASWTRDVQKETLTTRAGTRPVVASLRADDVREAVFAVVIGIGPAAGRYRITPDSQGATLDDIVAGRPVLHLDWPSAPTNPV